ncbi:hypothetical protein [Paenibacillus kribbensis]|uniref:hypothetical protein n=1 Tax=Paenibacillus kribbensis TaxID=172713 RepID=UPI00159F2C59|nr:hypothetical protein [Paenibacillus kribbensis]
MSNPNKKAAATEESVAAAFFSSGEHILALRKEGALSAFPMFGSFGHHRQASSS